MIDITTVSAAATTQVVTCNVTEKLCRSYYVTSSIQPSVNVDYSVADYKLVGTTEYVTVKANVTITYIPTNGSHCCPKTNIFTEYFTVAFADVTTLTTPTVTEADGIVEPDYVNCCDVAGGISAINVVTISIG
jgi:hypothetical protein